MYHPDYFNPKNSVRKDCFKRLETIKKHVNGYKLLDIGCSEGFYSFGLSNIFKTITAFDLEKHLIEKCLKIQDKNKTNINFSCGDITKGILLNYFDTILYMSIHHHVIEQMGLEESKKILKSVYDACGILIFDMGQKDEQNCKPHKWWNMLPATKDVLGWTESYIASCIGYNFKAEIIGASDIHNVKRYLWKIA